MASPDFQDRPLTDHALSEQVAERHRALASGTRVLPSLLLRSVFTLGALYGLLTLLLITVALLDILPSGVVLALGVGFAVLQFALGPWIMDLMLSWIYKMKWVKPDQLPEHLEAFVARVCRQEKMKFPSFGIIDDGAPEAFTYGHTPNNARIVISRGLMTLLEPGEVEAVAAHEIGHARNWDMALMTLASLVPILLFYTYRTVINFAGDRKSYAGAVAVGAYVLYIVSEYIVLWFSRTREYAADRFAGEATGNPSALAFALVKIAYGLAAQDSKDAEAEAEAAKTQGKGQEKEKKAVRVPAGSGPLAALNIFDRKAAVALVASSGAQAGERRLDLERVKGAMQWDLWNPWATYYEIHSTHPLVAKRLEYLSDQSAAMGQTPAVVFDRKQPESYWDDFFVDLGVILLPYVGLLAGVGAFGGLLAVGVVQPLWLGVAVALLGAGFLVKTLAAYRGKIYPHLSVAALLGHVKVSPVRPVPATVTGSVIGKGVPGLIWSEDFVMQDATGILFLDYRQPLAIWNFLFGLLRAGDYQGKTVRVQGWFRRAPMPYFEVYKLEVVDGTGKPRTCYSYHAAVGVSALVMLAGVAAAVYLGVVGI